MIKKIHYVWFGGSPLPGGVKSCIQSWERFCPDWEIKQWNESNFDVSRFRWVREALAARQYAFAADFVRLFVLFNEGGAYVDTDVEFLKDITPSIKGGFVTAIENHHVGTNYMEQVSEDGILPNGEHCTGFCLQAGFLYSEPHHPFVLQCMKNLYDNGNRRFVNDNDTFNGFVIDQALMYQIHALGGVFRDRFQTLKPDIIVYDSSVYATRKTKNDETYLVHWFDQSWKKDKNPSALIKRWIKRYLYFIYRR